MGLGQKTFHLPRQMFNVQTFKISLLWELPAMKSEQPTDHVIGFLVKSGTCKTDYGDRALGLQQMKNEYN